MSADERYVARTAAELRREFDATFAVRVSTDRSTLEDILAIRVGGDRYAVRLSSIAGLYADRQPVAIPSPVAELLGIVAIRGLLAPAYDLAALLGYPPATSARWLILVRVPHLVALAFASFEAHLRLPADSFAQLENGSEGRNTRHLRGSVRAGGALHPLIHVPGVLTTIEALAQPGIALQERKND